MMKITGLSHLFKWENLHNWWLTKYFLPHCILYVFYYDYLFCISFHIYVCVCVCVYIYSI